MFLFLALQLLLGFSLDNRYGEWVESQFDTKEVKKTDQQKKDAARRGELMDVLYHTWALKLAILLHLLAIVLRGADVLGNAARDHPLAAPDGIALVIHQPAAPARVPLLALRAGNASSPHRRFFAVQAQRQALGAAAGLDELIQLHRHRRIAPRPQVGG